MRLRLCDVLPAEWKVIHSDLQQLHPARILDNPHRNTDIAILGFYLPIESGCVLLPRGESRTAEFIDQFAAFPSGSHDDMVDACTQALNFLLYSHGGQGQAQEEACNPLLQESLYEIYGSERNPYV